MTREQFENSTNWKMSYEEYQKCDCTQCDKKDCIHREAFRRVPRIDGSLGLCPNLKQLYVNTENENDIVTLDEIRKRYIEINGTDEGFADYVSGGFYDGNVREYRSI